MKFRCLLLVFWWLMLLAGVASCGQMAERGRATLADSLNAVSYRYHYRNLDS